MYTLLNKRLGKKLEHPRFGVWLTSDFNEAQNMLRVCKQCASTYGPIEDDFVILDLETDNESTDSCE